MNEEKIILALIIVLIILILIKLINISYEKFSFKDGNSNIINISDFLMYTNGDIVQKSASQIASQISTLKSGSIVIWSGSEVDIPEGWVICDGTNNTPDLSGRFIVAARRSDGTNNTTTIIDPNDSTTNINITLDNKEIIYELGAKGGHNFPVIDKEMMPSHAHNFYDKIPSSQAGPAWYDGEGPNISCAVDVPVKDKFNNGGLDNDLKEGQYLGDSDTKRKIVKKKGETIPIDNRPKWYSLYYIMKK